MVVILGKEVKMVQGSVCRFFTILEGDFRVVLQGNEHYELETCLERI